MKQSIAIIITICIIIFMSGCETSIIKEYDNNPENNFNTLWTILDEKYCYFERKDIDWNRVWKIYHPKAKNAKDVLELFDILSTMIDTLQDGHVNLYTPFDISSCKGWYESYPQNYFEHQVYSKKYLGDDYRRAGGFIYNLIDKQRIGYIRYSSFSSNFSSTNLLYIDAIFNNTKGIIIDVRNNGGGSLDNSSRLASCFFDTKTITGYMRHKKGKKHNDFSEMEAIYTNPENSPIDWSSKKIVVLCNRRCYSATNDFIVRMKEAPNVIVIGGKTGGGGGIPLSQELPNGWMIRFSAIPMYDKNQNDTEFGVEPDIKITIKDSISTTDPIIEKAISIINNK